MDRGDWRHNGLHADARDAYASQNGIGISAELST